MDISIIEVLAGIGGVFAGILIFDGIHDLAKRVFNNEQ